MGAIGERDLRARDVADAERLQRLRHLHRAVKAVVIGQRDGRVALLGGDPGQLHRMRSAIQEGVGRVAVELDVGHEHMFASGSAAPAHSDWLWAYTMCCSRAARKCPHAFLRNIPVRDWSGVLGLPRAGRR